MMRGEEDGRVSPVHECEYIISFVSHLEEVCVQERTIPFYLFHFQVIRCLSVT